MRQLAEMCAECIKVIEAKVVWRSVAIRRAETTVEFDERMVRRWFKEDCMTIWAQHTSSLLPNRCWRHIHEKVLAIDPINARVCQWKCLGVGAQRGDLLSEISSSSALLQDV